MKIHRKDKCVKSCTITKPIAAYARHAVGNIYGGQTAAAIESQFVYARHAIGNGDRGQTSTIIEGIAANACHAIGGTIISDRSRNNNIS